MDTFQSRMFGRVKILMDFYQNGCLAVLLVSEEDEHDCITCLSVNFPEHAHQLSLNEFFPKIWTENEEVAREALASGAVVETGKRVMTPVGLTAIWRLA